MSANSSRLVDHVIKLTEHRDRGLLDITLTKALMDLLGPQKVAIFGVVTENNKTYWVPLAHQDWRAEAQRLSDPMWGEFENLESFDDVPHRAQSMENGEFVEWSPAIEGAPCISLFPLFRDAEAGADCTGVIEIHTEEKLSAQALNTVSRLQSVYRNMYCMLDYGERDALTGLLNRKSFDETFYKVLNDSRMDLGDSVQAVVPEGGLKAGHRLPSPTASYWLAMVDVDHFKRVNDVYGHQIGDEVLLLVARLLKKSFRSMDRVYRFGGEEFMVLMRCRDDSAVMLAAERFRSHMEDFGFPQVGRITASVGLTSVQSGDSPETARARADKALYYAKGNGRNRVCNYHDLMSLGLLLTETKVGDVELF